LNCHLVRSHSSLCSFYQQDSHRSIPVRCLSFEKGSFEPAQKRIPRENGKCPHFLPPSRQNPDSDGKRGGTSVSLQELLVGIRAICIFVSFVFIPWWEETVKRSGCLLNRQGLRPWRFFVKLTESLLFMPRIARVGKEIVIRVLDFESPNSTLTGEEESGSIL